MLQAADQIPHQRQLCERALLGEANLPPDAAGAIVTTDERSTERKRFYLREKKRLSELVELAAGHDAAAAANAADEAELAKLQRQVAGR